MKMKILIYGPGVIGATYGWYLSNAGEDITVFVREEKKDLYQSEGININCADFSKRGEVITDVFKPAVTSEITEDYELIMVCVNSHQVDHILPELEKAGNTDIIFFANNWFDNRTRFEKPNYLFGFSQIAGGGRHLNNIDAVIMNNPFTCTMLGEADGQKTERIKKISEVFKRAGLKPKISKDIISWQIAHIAWIASIESGIASADKSIDQFLDNKTLIKNTINACKEAFGICTARGVNPYRINPNFIYKLPTFILCVILKQIFSSDDIKLMFSKFMGAPEFDGTEQKDMLKKLLTTAEKFMLETPYLNQLANH